METSVTLRFKVGASDYNKTGQFYVAVVNRYGAARAFLVRDGSIVDAFVGADLSNYYYDSEPEAMAAIDRFSFLFR